MEIRCANLDFFRQQLKNDGVIRLSSGVTYPEAKLAILKSLGPVEFADLVEQPNQLPNILTTVNPIDRTLIYAARREAEKSPCWMGKVGCVVVNERAEIVTRGYNHPVTLGRNCEGLSVNSKDIMTLLKPGERLDFCQAIHDVEGVVAAAARDGLRLGGMNWYLSLEPCDRCANLLVETRPRGVYFSLGAGRERYYNSVGVERLVTAAVPTYFVEMMDNES